jgi:hypothetical protein
MPKTTKEIRFHDDSKTGIWYSQEELDIIKLGYLKDIDISIQSTRNMCKVIEVETLQQLRNELLTFERDGFTADEWNNDNDGKSWIMLQDINKVFTKHGIELGKTITPTIVDESISNQNYSFGRRICAKGCMHDVEDCLCGCDECRAWDSGSDDIEDDDITNDTILDDEDEDEF